MFPSDNPFYEIATLLLVSAVAGALALRLRQPLLLAFIAVGIIGGPSVLGIVDAEGIGLLAELGISLLLFAVGLKLDLHVVRALGPVALVAGLGQVALTFGAGLPIALALGFSPVESLYVAIGLAFSSTIIIVKLLSDKRELDELHGRLTLGILIVQDLVVIVVLVVLSAFGGGNGGSVAGDLGLVAVKAVAFLGAIALLMRFLLPAVLHRMAHSPELLLVFAIAWAVALAAGAEALGFTTEMGAFVAGVSLAATPYRDAIASRLVTVRDFLLLFFFIDVGASMELDQVADEAVAVVALSAFVLVAKPTIVVALLGLLRYRRRVSLHAALPLAQVSEFSLILLALGVSLDQVGEDLLTVVTAVALATIAVSVYFILGAEPLYNRLSRALALFERSPPRRDLVELHAQIAPEVVVLGLGRYGSNVVDLLRQAGVDVLAVDFDPRALSHFEERGIPVVYGDAEDPELPSTLPLGEARWVLSTVRRQDVNLGLLHALRHHGFAGRVAVAANDEVESSRLRSAGADEVLSPFADAARDAADIVSR